MLQAPQPLHVHFARLKPTFAGTVRNAAEALSLPEHMVRSTLKSVYGKLGVSEQSELGHLVAHLQFI